MVGWWLRLAIGEQVKLNARPFGDVSVEVSVFGNGEVLYELPQFCLSHENFGAKLGGHHDGS